VHCLKAQGASLRHYISAGSDMKTVKTRDLDLKSSNDAENKNTSKKETLQVISSVLPIR
jgi:hypothetical protein